MKISILGCGWFGLPLARHLAERGHQVSGSTTTPGKIAELGAAGVTPFVLDVQSLRAEDQAFVPFFDCEVLVITIPPAAREGYPGMIQNVAEVAKVRGISKVIYTSSTSVYGDGNRRVDELSTVAPGKASGKLVLAAENVLRAARELNVLIVRFGGLVGPGRSPAGFFRGRQRIPNGLAPINLIHLDDCLAITTQLVEGDYQNLILNAVTPHHPNRISFYSSAARAAGVPIPDFVEEQKNWKRVQSRYLSPVLHYQFRVDNWFRWLAEGGDA